MRRICVGHPARNSQLNVAHGKNMKTALLFGTIDLKAVRTVPYRLSVMPLHHEESALDVSIANSRDQMSDYKVDNQLQPKIDIYR